MKTAIIVGIGSDIGFEIAKRLIRDEWRIVGTYYETVPDMEALQLAAPMPYGACVSLVPHDVKHYALPEELCVPWDLLIFAVGTLNPIGRFVETVNYEWDWAVEVNALGPLRKLRSLYPYRNADAQVIFFDGPNLSVPTPTYSAYRAGKAILAAVIPTLRAECPDVRFDLLHTGVVKTKIHRQTLAAGERAANFERVAGIMAGREKTTSHDDIYAMLG